MILLHTRLVQHLSDNGSHEELQSAYKPRHSTESALMRVQHDITFYLADSRGGLVLLDLSREFDTVDVAILLKTMLEISDVALAWFSSDISDRTQRVRIGTDASEERPVKYGVLQGSVLGPLLFTVYTAPLQGTVTRHSDHKFAEDLQIYTSYCPHIPGDLECVIMGLGDCIGEVKC